MRVSTWRQNLYILSELSLYSLIPAWKWLWISRIVEINLMMHVCSPVIQCRCKSSNSSVKHRIVGLMDAGDGASQHFSTWQVQTPPSLSDSDRSHHTACRHTNIPINNEHAVPASSGGRKPMMRIHDVPMLLSIKTAACVRKTQHFVLFVGICITQYLKVFGVKIQLIGEKL